MSLEKTKKIGIVQIITGLEYGGAEQVVYDLANNINKNNFDVYVVSITSKTDRYESFKKIGIEPWVMGIDSQINLFKVISETWKLHQMMTKQNIKVIHAHLYHALAVSALLKLFNFNRKIVYTHHSNLYKKVIMIMMFILKPFRNVDVVFSKVDKMFFTKSNFKIIPNGIKNNIDLPENEHKNIFTFVCVARLRKVKNFQSVPAIVADLKSRGKYNFQVLIAGEGEMYEEIVQLIQKFDVSDKIKLLGIQKNVDAIYNQADVLLMPSFSEGMPITLLEAGLHGLTAIVTPVGSIPEYFNDETVYLADINSFADKMEYAINNKVEVDKKGQLLKKHILANFLIEKMVNKHEALYFEVNNIKFA